MKISEMFKKGKIALRKNPIRRGPINGNLGCNTMFECRNEPKLIAPIGI